MKKLIKPCGKCPYKLGLVHTLTNPCPQCRENNYSAYERFVGEQGGSKAEKNKTEQKK